MTPKEAEELVRARWIHGILSDGLYLYEGKRSYHLRVGPRRFEYTQKSKDECWLAAAEFTLRREEEIRQKREEIEWMSVNGGVSPPALRLLAVLETQLAALLAGWKETP